MGLLFFDLAYLDRPRLGSDFCSHIGEISDDVLDVPW